jgi:serine/threonine protein kinase
VVAKRVVAELSVEGTLIGQRYRLSQPIGRGRGGFVWIAEDTRVQRTVTAKPIGLRGPEDAAFALQHAKHAARLKHQCAVTVYDVLADGPQIWIITEYVPSRTLADFITSHGRLAPADTATLGAQLAAALAAAHELGLLHRAIEPPNVLLADDGGVQLTDFGIGALHGDAAYQAPEIIAGGPHTPASDVYALGATLFYAVEGVVPFREDGTSAPTLEHLAGTPLQPVLMRMLSADPALRPTMEGVWTALRAVADGRPAMLAPPLPAAQPAQPPHSPSTTGQHLAVPAMATAPQFAPVAAPPQAHPGRPQPSWPANGTAAAADRPVRPSGLPAPGFIAAAVVIAALVGVLFTELFLL